MSLPASPAAFAAIFNRRDLDRFVAFYTEDAVQDLGAGQAFQGRDAIRASLATFLAARLSIAVTQRRHGRSGDIGVAFSTGR